jgi:hypothetical protein
MKYNDNCINEAFLLLASNLFFIGSKLAQDGVFIRGGMSCGNLIHTSNNFIVGPAYIDAFTLECKHASEARIILSPKLATELNYFAEGNTYQKILVKFCDGYVGFHQMQRYKIAREIPVNDWFDLKKFEIRVDLERIRSHIISNLNNTFCDGKVFCKYKWLE